MSEGINSNGIDIVLPEISGFSTEGAPNTTDMKYSLSYLILSYLTHHNYSVIVKYSNIFFYLNIIYLTFLEEVLGACGM